MDLALNPPSEMVEQKEMKQLLRTLPMDNLHIQQKSTIGIQFILSHGVVEDMPIIKILELMRAKFVSRFDNGESLFLLIGKTTTRYLNSFFDTQHEVADIYKD